MNLFKVKLWYCAAAWLTFFSGCAGDPIIKPVPTDPNVPVLAQPIALVVDASKFRGYLINSNNKVEYSDGSLMVLNLVDPLHPTVLKTIPIKNFSGNVVFDPVNQLLYIANRLSENNKDLNDQLIQVNVNEAAPNFLSIQEYVADTNPFGLISDGSFLYAINERSLTAWKLADFNHRTQVTFNIRTTSQNFLQTTDTREAVFSPSQNFIFVSNRDDPLLVLNRKQIPAPDLSFELTSGGTEAVDYSLFTNASSTRGIAADDQFIYVVDGSPPALRILSDKDLPVVGGDAVELPLANLEVASIPLGEIASDPNEVLVDAAQNRAYVSLTGAQEIAVIDTATRIELKRISLQKNLPAGVKAGDGPFTLQLVSIKGKNLLYVLNLNSNTISIIDTASLQVVSSFP